VATPANPTLYDVAREAGVSLATASRVVNGSARKVNDAYRDRVLVAAKRLGYTPNVAAQAMARGESRTAVLILSDIEDPFFSSIAAGALRAADRAGLLVSLAVTERDHDRELELVHVLRRQRPAALLLAGSRSTGAGRTPAGADADLIGELQSFRDSGGRVVTIGGSLPGFSSVAANDRAAGAALAAALLAQGYRRPAVLAGPTGLVTAVERTAGLVEAFADAGHTIDSARIIHGEFGRDDGERLTAELLAPMLTSAADETLPFDLIVGVNDVLAVGALAALRRASIQVPEQIGVAGFDDIPQAKDASPSLTTVNLPLGRAGELAIDLALQDSDDVTSVEIETTVILRDSTRTH
jgi:LacI family transcriptional regulator